MTITITPTADDLVEYALYQNYRCPPARRARRERYVLYSIVLIAVIVGIAWRASQPGGLRLLVLFMPLSVKVFFSILGLVIIGAFAWPVIANTLPVIRWIAHRRIRRCPALFWQDLERREVTIEDNGVRIAADGVMCFTPWKHVVDVVRDHDRTYIEHGSARVELIRENMFASPTQFQEFIETIRRYRLAAVMDQSEAIDSEATSGGPSEEVDFTLNSDDFASLHEYFSKRFPARRRNSLIVLICLIFLTAALMTWLVWTMDAGWRTLGTDSAIAIAFIVWAEFMVLLVGGTFSTSTRKRLYRRAVAENPSNFQFFLTPLRVCLDDAGMRVFIDGCEEFLAWHRIPNVISDIRTNCLFICTLFSVHNIQAVIIPRRAFDSEFAFAEFCHQAETLWQAGHDDVRGTNTSSCGAR